MTAWDDLPDELRLQILSYLTHDKGNRAPYGSTCRQWQAIMEPFIFEEVTFYVTNASILSGSHTPEKLARIIRGPRLKFLKKLRLIVELDLFSITTISDVHLRRIKLGTGFVDMIDGFVDVLRDWGREASFDLEVNDVVACGHHLVEYGSELLSRDNKRQVDCVRALRLKMNTNSRWSCNRSFESDCELLNQLLATMSPNMKELSYGVERYAWMSMSSAGLLRGVRPFPAGLTHLIIRDISPPRDWEGLAWADLSERLEEFHVDYAIWYWGKTSFHTFCRGEDGHAPLTWPRLRRLTWGRIPLAEDPTEILQLVASAARKMPLLESLDLWGDSKPGSHAHDRLPLEAHFKYSTNAGFAAALYETSGQAQLGQGVHDAWAKVARCQGREMLEFDTRSQSQLDEMEPFPSAAVEELFTRHVYTPDPSNDQPDLEWYWPDYLMPVLSRPTGWKRKWRNPCGNDVECVDRHDPNWMRYLRRGAPGEESLIPANNSFEALLARVREDARDIIARSP